MAISQTLRQRLEEARVALSEARRRMEALQNEIGRLQGEFDEALTAYTAYPEEILERANPQRKRLLGVHGTGPYG